MAHRALSDSFCLWLYIVRCKYAVIYPRMAFYTSHFSEMVFLVWQPVMGLCNVRYLLVEIFQVIIIIMAAKTYIVIIFHCLHYFQLLIACIDFICMRIVTAPACKIFTLFLAVIAFPEFTLYYFKAIFCIGFISSMAIQAYWHCSKSQFLVMRNFHVLVRVTVITFEIPVV